VPRRLIGTVVKNQADKTVSVAVTHQKTHRLYHKPYQVSKKYLAHDAENKLSIGDRVELTETRPISKRKCWLVSKVITKAEEAAS
jgi:small subunit ribosomal protein S17